MSRDTKAAGLGSVRFKLKDDEGNQHNILLENVIYLPTATKNLLSIAQWSATNRDNCSVTSHGTQSVFRWNNDNNAKTIHHPPGCPIPLMAVNENDDHFALFIEMHSDKFLDKDAEYTHPIPSTAAPSVNKQFIEDSCEGGGSQLNLDEGDTVRTQLNGKTIICTIAKLFRTANGSIRAKVRPLNSDHTLVIDPKRIQRISPDPSDVPSGPQQVDRGSLTHYITEEEVKQLWNPKIDDTTTPESRIVLH